MPEWLALESKPEFQTIIAIFKGDVPISALWESRDLIAASPGFPEMTRLIINLSECRMMADSKETKELSMASEISFFSDHEDLRIAIIAPEDINFGMARVFTSYSDDSDKISVFKEKGEAYHWLGIG
jgi:hypothetical protein